MTRVLFLGSNWEALSTLKVLIRDDRFNIVGLITQPDKPVGRKRVLEESEIKKYAKAHGIPVFHTEGRKKRYMEALDLFEPELIVCKSFGEIVPGSFLDAPKYASINVHLSLLPKYRGAVPIQKAILEGDNVTGITYVKMVKGLDAGPILHQIEEPIHPDDTNQSLRERLVHITGATIGDILEDWVRGIIPLKEQDHKKATYCERSDISKENALIDWEVTSPQQAERMVRALIPWPVAWTYFMDKRLKIYKISFYDKKADLLPGEYVYDGDNLIVGTIDKNTPLVLEDVQLEGKTRMSGKQFSNGQDIKNI